MTLLPPGKEFPAFKPKPIERMSAADYQAQQTKGKGGKKNDDEEARICKDIKLRLEELLLARIGDFWFQHNPNGEDRTPLVGAKVKAMGGRRGVYDYTFHWKGHGTGHIEIKTPDNYKTPNNGLSADQIKFRDTMERFNIPNAVACNFGQVFDILKKWGVI